MTSNPTSTPAATPRTRHSNSSPSKRNSSQGRPSSRQGNQSRRPRRDDGPKVTLPPKDGTLRVNPSGFGFVDFGDESSAFVPPPLLGDLVDGDLVTVVPFGGPARLTADKVKLIERTRTVVAGTLTRTGDGERLTPDPHLCHGTWTFDLAGLTAVPGDLIVGNLAGTTVTATHVIDGTDRHGTLRSRVMARHNLPFDPAPAHGLNLTATLPALPATSQRRDLTDLVTMTIDADHSADLDDALSVRPADADGIIRVLVHISDVAEHVPAGCAADADAAVHATSVYFPGAHRPMFDPAISSDALSLLPGVDRDTLTVELAIDPTGEVTGADVFESRVRSDLRLSYDIAADVIAHRDTDVASRVRTTIDPADVLDALRWLRTASARLAASRARRGGLPARRVDPELALDDTGVPHALSDQGTFAAEPSEAVAAHDLIERLMVAANEAVAGWLAERELPGVFRVHEGPGAEAAEVIEAFCTASGVAAGLGGNLSPRALAALDAQFEVIGDPSLTTAWMLMFTPSATYSHRPGHHFGLASDGYVHFTSPIRRYADLCVHRVVKSYLAGNRDFASIDAHLEQVAAHVTEASGDAARGESQLRRALWLSILSDAHAKDPGHRYAARVTSVRDKGVRVVIDGTAAWGMVRFADMDGRWDLTGPGVATSDRGAALSVGDTLEVRITAVDEIASTFSLEPANRRPPNSGSGNGQRRGGRGGSRSGGGRSGANRGGQRR